MGFVEGPALDTLPKRTRTVTFDHEAADALYALAIADRTISDGEAYKDDASARKASQSAVRLLRKGHPEIGERVRTRTYADGDSWRWVLFLAPVDAKPAKGKGK